MNAYVWHVKYETIFFDLHLYVDSDKRFFKKHDCRKCMAPHPEFIGAPIA
jgi:hypothetical protein